MPRLATRALLILTTTAIAPPSPAQVTALAITGSQGVHADGQSVVAPGRVIPSGLDHGRVRYSADHRDGIIELTSVTTTNGRAPTGTTRSGALDLDVFVGSPWPIELDIELRLIDARGAVAGAGGSCAWHNAFRIEVVGQGQLSTPCPTPCVRRFERVLLDPAGALHVRISQQSWAMSARAFGSCRAEAELRCVVAIRPSSRAVLFGPSCGAALRATPSFAAPETYRIESWTNIPATTTALLVGRRRLTVPLPWGCTLLTDVLGALPVAAPGPDGRSRDTLRLPPTGGPWTLQAVLLDPASIRGSNGVLFAAR